jgi:hypothetical protein
MNCIRISRAQHRGLLTLKIVRLRSGEVRRLVSSVGNQDGCITCKKP